VIGAHGAHVEVADPFGWLLTSVLVLAPLLAYGRATGTRRAAGRRWPRWRSASFLVGLAMAAAAVSPPMRALVHDDPRAHMVQHLLLGMFAPLALVLAAPVTLLLAAIPVGARRRAGAVLRSRALHGLAHPATAAVLDVGGLYVLYLTPLAALTGENSLVHHLVAAHVLLAGYLFSWSIAGPDPAPRRPGTAVRVAVLIAAGAAHGLLAKLLFSRAGTDELQSAAQLMYYGGDVAELALAVALFASRYTRANRRDAEVRQACGCACAAPPPRPSSSPTTCGRAPSSAAAPERVPRPVRPARRLRHRPGPPPRWPAAR
jgi:putative membrane protein